MCRCLLFVCVIYFVWKCSSLGSHFTLILELSLCTCYGPRTARLADQLVCVERWGLCCVDSLPLVCLLRCCHSAQMFCQSTNFKLPASTSGQCYTTAPSKPCGTGSSFCWSSTRPSWRPTQPHSCSAMRWGLMLESNTFSPKDHANIYVQIHTFQEPIMSHSTNNHGQDFKVKPWTIFKSDYY